jgi:hypothetical protein
MMQVTLAASPPFPSCLQGIKEPDGEVVGVVGSSQPVSAADWHSGKAGLFVAAAYDQTVSVGMASRVNAL